MTCKSLEKHTAQNVEDLSLSAGILRFKPSYPPYFSIPISQENQLVVAATSTRIGGISERPYHTLNLAYHVEDVQEAVTENRRRFCEALDISMGSLVTAQQVHGDRIAVIHDSQAGRGAHSHQQAIPGIDAMITRSRLVTLAILTADCVPVLIVDPVREAMGAAHAGWRGALSQIAAKTVREMQNVFGTAPADCQVALGPSIGPCCYEVSEDLISQFCRKFGPESCVEGKKLDLQWAVKKQLTNAGIIERNILCEGLCTACNTDLFYSYRAEGGRTGRMMSIIRLY